MLLSEEDAVSEQGEACSTVHLARDPFVLGVDTLGGAVAVRKRERLPGADFDQFVSAGPPYPPADLFGAVEAVELSDGAQLRELNACLLQQMVFLCCEAGTDARWP
ncbi:hypothetical protein [Streptomyces sp. NPDC096934]|uniref:hypothetical protein n=1 Tax=Streptomyces sp. NPDC096934 TaxID=3155551 RepID=UPI00332BA0F2